MARYSTDSDSDRSSKHRRKHYGRTRSTSSDSSGSSSYKRKSIKHSKTKRRHRTRSRSRDRDRSSKSYKYSRDDSRDRERRKQKSRRSRSQSAPSHRKQRRSISREKSTSRSSSSQSTAKPIVSVEKVQVIPKDDFSIAPNIKESILEEINSEGFAPKHFSSTAQNKESSKSKPIVIDITADTILVPPITTIIQSDSIFHTSIMGDQEGRFDKWVKKLYLIRQKAQPETMN